MICFVAYLVKTAFSYLSKSSVRPSGQCAVMLKAAYSVPLNFFQKKIFFLKSFVKVE